MRARSRWLFAGMAFIVGLLAGLALGVFDAPATSITTRGAEATALLVTVANDGHDADVQVSMGRAASGATPTWAWRIPDGAEQTARNPQPRGETTVTVSAVWSSPSDSGRGTGTFLLDPADCPGEDMLLVLRLDTRTGVSIAPTGPATCV